MKEIVKKNQQSESGFLHEKMLNANTQFLIKQFKKIINNGENKRCI